MIQWGSPVLDDVIYCMDCKIDLYEVVAYRIRGIPEPEDVRSLVGVPTPERYDRLHCPLCKGELGLKKGCYR